MIDMIDLRCKGLVLEKELRVTEFESRKGLLLFGFSRSIRKNTHRFISGNPRGCHDEPRRPDSPTESKLPAMPVTLF